ncbi:unnamed protein product [Withania somnifera]
MASSSTSQIHVFPQFIYAKRSLPSSASSENNFNLEIDVITKHSYISGENTIDEYNFGTKWAHTYKSLSWDIIDKELSAIDFPYPLERIKWDYAEKILENKDDLIEQILGFARMMQSFTHPFQDDDIIYATLIFDKKHYVSPQEFELTKTRIISTHNESRAKILWGQVYNKIKGLGRHESSLDEELQSLEGYIEESVRKTAHWSMYVDENYERGLVQSLTEQARREFRSLLVMSTNVAKVAHVPSRVSNLTSIPPVTERKRRSSTRVIKDPTKLTDFVWNAYGKREV